MRAKRIGWSVKGNRKKDNQTIEVNRNEILKIVNSACYADYLFQRMYYGEKLLAAVAGRVDSISKPGSLEQFRQTWLDDVFTIREIPVDENVIRLAREEFSGLEMLTPVEQAILYVLRLGIDKEHRETILNALFAQLPRSSFAQHGKLKCMQCGQDTDITDALGSGRSTAFCSWCGQRIL